MALINELVARVPLISSDSKGPVVNLAAWISMVTMCLAVFTVLISKLIVLRKLGYNDLIITFAMLFSIGHTVAISEQVTNGLGTPRSDITGSGFIDFQRTGYVSQLMYILTIFTAKTSTLTLLMALTPQVSHRRPMLAVGVIMVLWGFVSLLAAAFQCSLPRPYLYVSGKCFNQTAFWKAVGVVDIFTDVAIMVLPVILVHNLQLARKKKITVVFAFSFRLFAIACTIFRLVELPTAFEHGKGSDVTFDSWLFAVATLLAAFSAVFATCVPHLRPFMESIQAGYMSGAIHEGEGRTAYGSGKGEGSYVLSKLSKGGNSLAGLESKRNSFLRSQLRSDGDSIRLPKHGQTDVEEAPLNPKRPSIGQALSTNDVITTAKGGETGADRGQRDRSDSAGSDGARSGESTGSKAMIIKTTKEWSVSYQE